MPGRRHVAHALVRAASRLFSTPARWPTTRAGTYIWLRLRHGETPCQSPLPMWGRMASCGGLTTRLAGVSPRSIRRRRKLHYSVGQALAILVLALRCAAGDFATPVPSVMPAWVRPYPGVSAENRRKGNSVESAFTVTAAPHDVLSHYRALFKSAAVPFDPDPMGGGFLIRALLPECDLEVAIRRQDPNTTVRVTCSPRLAATQRIIDEHTEEHAQARAAEDRSDGMKKFDTPVYPEHKASAPLVWPSWLVCVDGTKLRVERLPGQLKSSFRAMPPREAIQAYYTRLLAAHRYRVTSGLWLEATADPDVELGRRVVVWVKIKPAGEDFAVDITVQ